jgi:hypothetical protein
MSQSNAAQEYRIVLRTVERRIEVLVPQFTVIVTADSAEAAVAEAEKLVLQFSGKFKVVEIVPQATKIARPGPGI